METKIFKSAGFAMPPADQIPEYPEAVFLQSDLQNMVVTKFDELILDIFQTVLRKQDVTVEDAAKFSLENVHLTNTDTVRFCGEPIGTITKTVRFVNDISADKSTPEIKVLCELTFKPCQK